MYENRMVETPPAVRAGALHSPTPQIGDRRTMRHSKRTVIIKTGQRTG
jgi:hypothetical protein